ncbi:MAG: hypothetical protein GY679_02170 [Mycoplasma sp.]|nr:hypothetical protein [Mycoplasma sp.]
MIFKKKIHLYKTSIIIVDGLDNLEITHKKMKAKKDKYFVHFDGDDSFLLQQVKDGLFISVPYECYFLFYGEVFYFDEKDKERAIKELKKEMLHNLKSQMDYLKEKEEFIRYCNLRLSQVFLK